VKYPEHEKLAKIKDKSQCVYDFLEFVSGKSLELCRWEGEDLRPCYGKRELIAEFFEIDLKKLEAEIAKGQGDFNVNAQLQKKDFMDREAKVYLQVYNEIERAVSQFAREHGIAVVHRFDGDPVDSADRNRILGSITKPIVYYDPQIDITPDVLKMLNGAAVAGQPQVRPVR
jgi:hypothetical protein